MKRQDFFKDYGHLVCNVLMYTFPDKCGEVIWDPEFKFPPPFPNFSMPDCPRVFILFSSLNSHFLGDFINPWL